MTDTHAMATSLPAIKCSDCQAEVQLHHMSIHVCGKPRMLNKPAPIDTCKMHST
ncbi:uncharacterized protein BYT42DRAFT_561856 [Radiomyces spectabilis]|uniref:uncharacterized protein n=1 Tax=Radiomyces spectabilis TaxID=64574 RepID=UPI00221FC487|nr:uncharacterized protein BYT42DRAFT_561856 [Radiomyces spectabilis]KAI8384242.1 hypothetical protein BYT42DRAFT_561856 [Radiomyces spectabilis]